MEQRNIPGTILNGKYLVQRRDGTVPEWPWFVLGGRDPVAPWAMYAYAIIAFCIRFDRRYAHDVWRAAGAFRRYRKLHGKGNPDGPRHRIDNPAIVELIENRTTEKEEHGYGQSDGYGSCGYPKPKQ